MFSSDGGREDALSQIYGFIQSLGPLVQPHIHLLRVLVMFHQVHTSAAK